MNSCCPEGSLQCLKIENTNYQGKIIELGKMKLYHVGTGNKAILYSFDIFGFGSGRTFQICDYFASKGYQVFMPDFFLNNPYPNKPIEADVINVIKNFPFDSNITPLLRDQILPFMIKNKVEKIAVLGTCWGAWNNFKLASLPEFKDLVKCAISVHPSLRIEEMFGNSVEDMVKSLYIPQLVISSKNELPRIKPKGELINIMMNNLGCINDPDVTNIEKEKIDFSSKVLVHSYENMVHGYFSRGELSNQDVKIAVLKTFWLIEEFLKKQL